VVLRVAVLFLAKSGLAKRSRRKSPNDSSAADRRPGSRRAGAADAASSLRVRKLAGEDVWELVHPRCARDRELDLEEVRKMLQAGEVEVATDECRWLLSGCSDCLEAHRILGEIALESNDLPLARGHFGYAYRLGAKALETAGRPSPVPYRLPANQGFFESGKGLAWCLKRMEKLEMAEEVVAVLLRCDPTDPLGVRGLLAGDSPEAT
jgi:hypothetical protein